MQLLILLNGLLIGMLISIPTGPVGFLCVRRALVYPYRAALISALGSIVADLIFGLIGVFSLTSISEFYSQEQTPIKLVGALILIYVGVKTFANWSFDYFSKFKKYEELGNFASTFILTMTNPVQIITLPIVFAAVGTGIRPDHFGDASIFMLGLAIGAVLLWMMLIVGVSSIRKKIHERHLSYINRISGALIAATGLYLLLSQMLS